MQTTDSAILAIEALRTSGRKPSYAWLRRTFGVQKDAGVYRSLKYGRAIIATEDQLNQYLYSYGPMVESQWAVASQFLTLNDVGPGTRWIDYGCGQGLAGLLLYERLGSQLFNHVRTIVLVEPSSLALERAKAIYGSIAPQSAIIGVEKTFRELQSGDLKAEGTENTVHVFSNVLDINGYDHLGLLGSALSPGRHTILVVGTDRDFDGGSPNIKRLKAAVEDPRMSAQIKVIASTLEPFNCDNRGEPAIMWHCQLDVTP